MPQPIRSLVPMAFVKSPPASAEFYGKLGFRVLNTFTQQGATEFTWAWLQGDDASLMIVRARQPIDADQQAILFYVYVDDVDAKHAELTAAGVAPSKISYEFYAPGGEFRVVDPDGYVLMFTHTDRS